LTVAVRTVPDFRMVSAVLTNRDVGDARARIGGRITQILVKEGDKVRAGQTMRYHLTSGVARAVAETLAAHFCAMPADKVRPK
ncbi:MAG: biotin/lipoyl-binding protein, partial [Chloroflexales bacterium]|nr:biotin/lipoyl-binding protein [Chloroflexales bacterium]